MRNIKLIIVILLTFGIIFLTISVNMPKYTDCSRFDELCNDYYENNITRNVFDESLSEITTSKIFMMDLSIGIISFSLIIFLFLSLKKIKTIEDLKNIKTPNKKRIIIYANIGIIIMFIGIYFYYYYRGMRGDYFPFEDSIGIPIYLQTINLLIMIIPINLFFLIFIYRSILPTKVFITPEKHNSTGYILCRLILFILLLASIITLVLFVVDGDIFSIFVNLLYIYLLLSLRAGEINFYNYKATNKNQLI